MIFYLPTCKSIPWTAMPVLFLPLHGIIYQRHRSQIRTSQFGDPSLMASSPLCQSILTIPSIIRLDVLTIVFSGLPFSISCIYLKQHSNSKSTRIWKQASHVVVNVMTAFVRQVAASEGTSEETNHCCRSKKKIHKSTTVGELKAKFPASQPAKGRQVPTRSGSLGSKLKRNPLSSRKSCWPSPTMTPTAPRNDIKKGLAWFDTVAHEASHQCSVLVVAASEQY